ncbi:3-oxoacyl-ACP synthase III family protein [Streptomyces sp. NPDC059680]|uniref:3-oxoacyl-ACP synthase III family protein n=1 Tax=Streptomyces sp. NPDC059680 TaxID=3346904 RepID=UPI0036B7F3D7
MMNTQASRFEALGVCLPSAVVTTPDLLAQVVGAPRIPLQRITGVAERRWADRQPDAGEDSFGMALKAAQDALCRSRYQPGDLDVVISASITRIKDGDRHYVEPSFGRMLAEELGAHGAITFDVSNACAGMMTGVYLLDRMIRAGFVRNGIVVSGEQITRIAETAAAEMTGTRDLQFASLSVGDSAVAVVLDESVDEADRIHYVDLMTSAEYAQLCLGMPSDRTSGAALYTKNMQMHTTDRLSLWTGFLQDELAKKGRTFEDEKFDYIIQHQVGARFIDSMNGIGETTFGTAMPPSLSVVEEFGNTATTSHFLVLAQHLRAGTARRGAKFLMVPGASGLVFGFLSATISNVGV